MQNSRVEQDEMMLEMTPEELADYARDRQDLAWCDRVDALKDAMNEVRHWLAMYYDVACKEDIELHQRLLTELQQELGQV